MAEHESRFHDLTVDELYAILALRQQVFVVEQTCTFLDCDGHDQRALHLWRTASDGRVVCYARILPPGEKFAEASLGRVATDTSARRRGEARAMVQRALRAIERHYGSVPVRLAAQAYLEGFYAALGFARVSADYLDDGIAHVDMLRAGRA